MSAANPRMCTTRIALISGRPAAAQVGQVHVQVLVDLDQQRHAAGQHDRARRGGEGEAGAGDQRSGRDAGGHDGQGERGGAAGDGERVPAVEVAAQFVFELAALGLVLRPVVVAEVEVAADGADGRLFVLRVHEDGAACRRSARVPRGSEHRRAPRASRGRGRRSPTSWSASPRRLRSRSPPIDRSIIVNIGVHNCLRIATSQPPTVTDECGTRGNIDVWSAPLSIDRQNRRAVIRPCIGFRRRRPARRRY